MPLEGTPGRLFSLAGMLRPGAERIVALCEFHGGQTVRITVVPEGFLEEALCAKVMSDDSYPGNTLEWARPWVNTVWPRTTMQCPGRGGLVVLSPVKLTRL